MTSSLPEVILIEDDPGHAELIRRNLIRSGVSQKVRHFFDGQSGLDYLAERFPDGVDVLAKPMVLLDINMEGMSGLEVLQTIKSSELWRSIPVIMLTTTENQDEIARCYDFGCNAFIVKPLDYTEFRNSILKLGMFLSVMRFAGGDPRE